MKTDTDNGTAYKCPRCGKPMREDWSHFDEYKCILLYCNACQYNVLGDDPKDAYNSIKRKDDKE